jgi:membrane-bound ClpP family serine protease
MKKKKITKDKTAGEPGFALGKENYKLMAIGFGIIIIGFILMIGGGSDDPNVFNPEIFSFRRITLAPMILLFGFLFEIYAIMKKPKENK